ncbi:hypothetical protein GGS20DRAFT_596526 [Poronia punctata]|nr:hypothetical protein GGS20DRAFT_596526 [Poronia punctata]
MRNINVRPNEDPDKEARARRKELRQSWRSGATEKDKRAALRLAVDRLGGKKKYSWLQAETPHEQELSSKRRRIALELGDAKIDMSKRVSEKQPISLDPTRKEMETPTPTSPKADNSSELDSALGEIVQVDGSAVSCAGRKRRLSVDDIEESSVHAWKRSRSESSTESKSPLTAKPGHGSITSTPAAALKGLTSSDPISIDDNEARHALPCLPTSE